MKTTRRVEFVDHFGNRMSFEDLTGIAHPVGVHPRLLAEVARLALDVDERVATFEMVEVPTAGLHLRRQWLCRRREEPWARRQRRRWWWRRGR